MLEAQRQRHSPDPVNVRFTRRVLWTQITLLVVVTGFLTFHGLFFYALAALLTLMVTVLAIVGMQCAQEWCRLALALISLAVGIACFLLVRFPLEHAPGAEGVLALRIIPIWAGFAAIVSALLFVFLVFSSKIRYTSRRLFTLW